MPRSARTGCRSWWRRDRGVPGRAGSSTSGFGPTPSIRTWTTSAPTSRRLHALFLSHGHPDHFGGLDAVVGRLRRARARVPMLYHPAATRARRWVWDDLVGGVYRLTPEAVAKLAPSITPEVRAEASLALGDTALFLTSIPRRVAYEAKRPGARCSSARAAAGRSTRRPTTGPSS